MSDPADYTSNKVNSRQRSLPLLILDFFSGFKLATILLLTLMALTWFATLEQVEHGLYATLQKIFHLREMGILSELKLPILKTKLYIPMPGGWWVLALLFVNLFLGGIIRASKKPQKIFIFISHCAILFMILSAGVTQKYELRGTMDFFEGDTSNVAQDYYEHVVEIAEHTTSKPDRYHVIRGKYVMDLTKENEIRTVRLPNLPFDIELTRYAENGEIRAASSMPPASREKVIDGFYIFNAASNIDKEINIGACYARVLPKSGEPLPAFILTAQTPDGLGAKRPAHTIRVDDRTFTIDMRKFLWVMPFSVRLEKATATYYPNTTRPESFESRVTRIENGTEAVADIRMNEPMRYKGMTFYQRMMGGGPAVASGKPYSQLEVVHNPADKWPEYSLYVVTIGLCMHFLLRLALFFKQTLKRFSVAP